VGAVMHDHRHRRAGWQVSFAAGIVQGAGVASIIRADALQDLSREFEPLQSRLMRHEQVILAVCRCNASHTVEARMCRWLLRIRDLTQSDEMSLTQEFLAQMLGVRRTSVSLVAGTLQRAESFIADAGMSKLLCGSHAKLLV
jgi:CRP-like cAMP-binding protein